MSEAKHTPGPWLAYGSSVVLPPTDSGIRVLIADCDGRNGEFRLPDFESAANAEIIVRACNAHGDLLAALKAILGVDNPARGEAGHIDFVTAVEMGHAVIKKAEGKS